MINRIRLIRNVGNFDSVSPGADLAFRRVVLVYAENGRGKTTVAAILRSLSTGDPIPVSERHRLAATHPPHVVIDCGGGSSPATFTNGAWNRTLPNVAIFDDAFVNDNIYSGLAVEAGHRQRLHELVLGVQGVDLHRKVKALVAKIDAHNTELKVRGRAIPAAEMGGLSVDDFCALPPNPDVDDAIQETERKLAAVREQDPIRKGSLFDRIVLPEFDLADVGVILNNCLPDLDSAAAQRVQDHVDALGRDGETWLADGLRYADAFSHDDADACPFCLQSLGASTIIGHYRAYFSEEYARLKSTIAAALANVNRTHDGDVPAAFERAVRVAVERRQFWSRFCDVPQVVIDTAEIVRTWREAREAVASELEAKRGAPLDRRVLPEAAMRAFEAYETHRQRVVELGDRLEHANDAIRLVKEQAASGGSAALEADLARLKAQKARHVPATSALCDRYLEEKATKAKTASLRDQARADLETYRTSVFPTYQDAVNGYLQKFNAGFRVSNVNSVNTRSGTACNYNVLINNQPVPVAGGTPRPGTPSFKNTLSSGDRHTLALAFFFATLDQDPGLSSRIVIVDDPISSLDEHRSLTTVQEIRRLAARVEQVIVLSHDRGFLAQIWKGLDGRGDCEALEIVRASDDGSTISAWNVEEEATTEYDRRHALLRDCHGSASGNPREVAEAIRFVLEGYVRVACPADFAPGSLLGPFLGVCEQRVGTPQEILVAGDIEELRDLLEYANRFHHDTNPAWQTETINDGELRGYVNRTLEFVKP